MKPSKSWRRCALRPWRLGLAGIAAILVTASGAYAQQIDRQPRIGYLFPAGGRAGSIFTITVGGQYLRNVSDVRVSGGGVRVAGIRYIGRFRPIFFQKNVVQGLKRKLDDLRRQRAGILPPPAPPTVAMSEAAKAAERRRKEDAKLPRDQPLLQDLDHLTDAELQLVAREYLDPAKRETTKGAIGERVRIELMIDPDAAPGDREIRLVTPTGVSNPMTFEIGLIPETTIGELKDAPAAPLELPAVVNGQIMADGEADRFAFHARAGQRLVIQAEARRLIPYLADAVPGWFQVVMTLSDPAGRQAACTDHYRFDQDPVILYQVPADGDYQLEVRDTLFRAREDFVYRVTISEQPFITEMFPLGGQAGVPTTASISGWNLPELKLPLDTRPGKAGPSSAFGFEDIRRTALLRDGEPSNPVAYAVDALPERMEVKPNGTAESAQPISLPVIVNGRIARNGDESVFRFEGRAGDEVAAEVVARRLGSPLDSLLRITDASGKELARNDDRNDPAAALITHQADSYLRLKLPADGAYYLYLTDAQGHGGEAYAYRLRVSAPEPDFALRMTPSTINLSAGRVAPIWIYALRRDGFDGDIEISLKDPPAGVTLAAARIPHGRDSVRITLTAPQKPSVKPVELQLEGRAQIAGETVLRPVVPADDMMQAFAYHHLAPAQDLLLSVRYFREGPQTIAPEGAKAPVRLPAGGSAQLQIRCPSNTKDVRFELLDPPKGVSLGEITRAKDSVSVELKADGGAPPPGYADNLIVEAYRETEVKAQGGVQGTLKRRQSLGVLPAIAFEIVKP